MNRNALMCCVYFFLNFHLRCILGKQLQVFISWSNLSFYLSSPLPSSLPSFADTPISSFDDDEKKLLLV